MFQTALKDATAADKQRTMQVDSHSSVSRSSSKENVRQRSPQRNTMDARDIIRRRRSRREAEERAALDKDLDDINRRVDARRGGESQASFWTEGDQQQNTKPVKCQYWPQCKAGDACPFIHPSEQCRYFPACSFGDQCLYIHPSQPCRFQDKCANPNCNYQHKSPGADHGDCTAGDLDPAHPPIRIHHATCTASCLQVCCPSCDSLQVPSKVHQRPVLLPAPLSQSMSVWGGVYQDRIASTCIRKADLVPGARSMSPVGLASNAPGSTAPFNTCPSMQAPLLCGCVHHDTACHPIRVIHGHQQDGVITKW